MTVAFGLLGGSATLGVAISITFRLCLMTIGVLGGAFLLVPGSRAELRQLALDTAPPAGDSAADSGATGGAPIALAQPSARRKPAE